SGWTEGNQNVEAIYRSDVGSALLGGSGAGSLELRFSFWNGGSYGQGIPAVGPGVVGVTVAPGAWQNADRRTNVGALNTSNQTIKVRVQVIDGMGATVATETWTLEPYGQRQVSLSSLGVLQLNGGSVVFEMTSGAGSYRGYLSTIDAITGDAVYTAAQ
ncbi:MAG: hypothetical protein K8R59_03040, partial [Thermoanaerobaculales bacterium]|nr:hypothetical protein [Thermoanaerobaculales bacterium]